MEIIDDFLEQTAFDELQTLIKSNSFAWYYSDTIDYKGQKDKFMFNHMFYTDGSPSSPFCQNLNPTIN